MKKKIIEEKVDNNGIYTKVETIEKDFDDGFVHEVDFHQVNTNNYGMHHKGVEKSFRLTTNNPIITRLFVRFVCGIFFVIGLFLLLIGIFSSSFISILFGIILIVFISIIYKEMSKDIDEIEEKLKQNEEFNKMNSKAVQKEFTENLGEWLNDSKKSIFTKANFKLFVKKTLPLYILITIITFLLIAFFVNIILGFLVLGILILCGLVYYLIASLIFKY